MQGKHWLSISCIEIIVHILVAERTLDLNLREVLNSVAADPNSDPVFLRSGSGSFVQFRENYFFLR